MLKFLRKYNKIILVVGGSLLMIAFLLPQALSQLGRQQANRTVGRINGKAISAQQAGLAAQEMGLVEETLLGVSLRDNFQVDNAVHWEMLVREAKAMGLVGGAGRADAVITEFAPVLAQLALAQRAPEARTQENFDAIRNIAAEQMRARAAAISQKWGPRALEQAMANFAGIMQLRGLYNTAARASEPEARVIGHDIADQAQVDVAAIQSEDLVSRAIEPSPEALQAHFEKYKSVAEGKGEFGFGYLQPAAIKVEWLTLSRSQLAGLINPDPIEVRKRWQADREKYKGEFEAERAAVQAALREEGVNNALREADQIVRAEIAQEQKKYPEAPRGRAVPPNWRESAKPLPDIAFLVKERLGARSIPYQPVVSRRETWQDADELRIVPGLGQAAFPVGARKAPLAEVYNEVREIGGAEARGPQVGLLTGPAVDLSGDYHYFRILDARPEGPPESLDVVRERATRDLKRLNAYTETASRADEIRQKAIEGGLPAILIEYPGAIATPGFISKAQAFLQPASLNTPALREQVMRLAGALDPTKPIADNPAGARFAVIPVSDALAIAVIEIKGVQPLSKEDFESNILQIANAGDRRPGVEPLDNPFTWERTSKRNNWEPVGGKEDENTDGDLAADETPKS